MIIRIADSANAEIVEILRNVKLESNVGADSIAKRLDEVFVHLAEFPNMGRPTNRRDIRWVNTYPYPYLVFYKVVGSSHLEVAAVRHGSRNPRSMPARPR